jgi:hypothetical protein
MNRGALAIVLLFVILMLCMQKPTARIGNYRERYQIMPTDADYLYGPLDKGTYGDVPVYFNEEEDNKFAPIWRDVHAGLYLHNNKTWWKTNYNL